MSWNYRIVEYADGSGFGLHEVHYNGAKAISMTEQPTGFVGDTKQELYGALMLAKSDAYRRPVFQEPKEWIHDETRV